MSSSILRLKILHLGTRISSFISGYLVVDPGLKAGTGSVKTKLRSKEAWLRTPMLGLVFIEIELGTSVFMLKISTLGFGTASLPESSVTQP